LRGPLNMGICCLSTVFSLTFCLPSI